MKYLIVGLGNIGLEYEQTRHNIGFDVVDALAKSLNIEFTLQKHAIVGEGRLKNKQLILLKPTTFMNLSGKAVQYHAQAHQIPLEQILVITDDLALDLGTIRLRPKGSHGGHNGLRHIEETLLTQNYPRLRFGIGNQFDKRKQTDFVLGQWKDSEKPVISEKKDKAMLAVQSFVLEGLPNAMTKYNG